MVASKVASALSAEIISSYAATCSDAKNPGTHPHCEVYKEQVTVATVEGRIVELNWIGGNFVKFLCGLS